MRILLQGPSAATTETRLSVEVGYASCGGNEAFDEVFRSEAETRLATLLIIVVVKESVSYRTQYRCDINLSQYIESLGLR